MGAGVARRRVDSRGPGRFGDARAGDRAGGRDRGRGRRARGGGGGDGGRLTRTAGRAHCALAVVVHHANGQFLGVSPHRGVSAVSIPGSVAAAHAGSPSSLAPTTGNLSYHSGPVIHSSTPYLIFWTPSGHSLPSGSESLIE